MADPLSVVASVIAVAGATETVCKTLSKVKMLRKAPNGLLSLHNEITGLTIILRTVERHLSSSESEKSALPQDILQQISTLVDRANDHVLQLHHLIHYRFLESGSLDGDYKVFRLRWITSKETIENHRGALKEIREDIQLQLLILNCAQQSRIRLMIEEVFLISSQIRSGQLNTFDMAAQLKRHSEMLNEILVGHGGLRDRLRSTQMLTTQQVKPLNDISQKGITHHYIPSVVGVKTHLSMFQRHPCFTSCTCNCHDVKSFKSPHILKSILGFLFVRYSGYPLDFSQPCSDSLCQSQPRFNVRVVYYFPFWLFGRMIDVSLMASRVQELSISLTIRGTIFTTADVYRAIALDDDQDLRHMLGKRGARPNDVSVNSGDSALLMTIARGCFKSARVLIDAGADPYIENNNGLSAFMCAWDLVYAKLGDQVSLNLLRELFPDNDNVYFQERGFSRLHKAVLGIDHPNLEEILLSDRGDINALDSNRASPLIWAIRRKDAISVKLLLQAGADPNIRNKSGATALHFAAWQRDFEIVKILLRHGAMAAQKDNNLKSPLHDAASRCSNSNIIMALLAAGADLQAHCIYGATALSYAASSNNVLGTAILLDLGAQINAADRDGDTPLLDAARNACSASVELLLERGASCTTSNMEGNTILHMAAQSGDLQMLNVIRNASLKSIDPNARNAKGKTAFQVAQERVSKPDGFIDLLLVLLFEIRNRNDYLAGCQRPNIFTGKSDDFIGEDNGDGSSGHGSDTEEFFDAQE